MNIDNLTKAIRKTTDEKEEKQKNQTIGILHKRKRLDLGLTQDEVAKSICSISYLSKIETNKIIPNPRCIELLMEKIKIPKWEIYILENGPELIQRSLDDFYLINLDDYKELFLEVVDIDENHTVDIIKLGYYVLTNNLDNVGELIDRNIKLVSSMDANSVNVFALYASEYFLKVSDFAAAYELQKSLLAYAKKNDKINSLINDLSLRLYAKTGRATQSAKIYSELELLYARTFSLKRLTLIKFAYAELLFDEEEYEATIDQLKEMENVVEYDYIDEFNALLGASYSRLNKDITAKEYLDKISYSSKEFIRVIDDKFKISENQDLFIEEVKKMNDLNSNYHLSYFLEKQNNSISKDLFESKEYIEAFKCASIYEAAKLYSQEKEFLVSNSKYKDACHLSKKIQELFNKYKN